MKASEVIDRVRDLIQDTVSSGFRWVDAEMLRWISDGQREIARRRPDALFLTVITTTNTVSDITAVTNDLEITDFFSMALVDYVASRCLEKDSEDPANLQRASYYLERFIRELS